MLLTYSMECFRKWSTHKPCASLMGTVSFWIIFCESLTPVAYDWWNCLHIKWHARQVQTCDSQPLRLGNFAWKSWWVLYVWCTDYVAFWYGFRRFIQYHDVTPWCTSNDFNFSSYLMVIIGAGTISRRTVRSAISKKLVPDLPWNAGGPWVELMWCEAIALRMLSILLSV